MTSNETKTKMIKDYNRLAATHNYVFGFEYKKQIYAVEIHNACELLEQLTYIEKRSKTGYSLRFRPNKTQKELLLTKAVKTMVLGSTNWFENEKQSYNNNRGDCFENIAAIKWNGKQPTNRNENFTICGDFNANGIEYQVKFGSKKGAATFTTEATLKNLRA